MLDASDVPAVLHPQALRRAMLVAAGVPAVLATVFYLGAWGAGSGLALGTLTAAAAVLATDVLLIGYRGVPCAHAWQHERPLLRRCWLPFATTTVWCVAMPAWAHASGGPAVAAALFVMAAVWWAARLADAGLRRIQAAEDAAPDRASFHVLGLE
jgi:hypothetical protein